MTTSRFALVRITAGPTLAGLLTFSVSAHESSGVSFDELPSQPVNGLSIAGFTFWSEDAVFNAALPGPGHAIYIDEHALVGPVESGLGISFDRPPKYFSFAFAIDTFEALDPALTITCFDRHGTELGVDRFLTYLEYPEFYPSDIAYKYTWLDFDWPDVQVSRIELSFGWFGSYAIDTLFAQYSGEPLPEAGTWGAGMTLVALMGREWRRRRFARNTAAGRT